MRALLCLSIAAAPLAGLAQINHYGGNTNPFGPPVQWTTILQGTDSKINAAGQVMITSQNQWEGYYRQMAGILPGAPCRVPTVADWGTQSLIVVHTGAKRSPGWGINVQTIGRTTSNYWDVQFAITQPHPSSIYQSTSLYSPFAIIRVERTIGIPRYFYHTVTSPIIHISNNHCGCGCHGGGGGVYMWQNGQFVDLTKQNGGSGNGNGHGHGGRRGGGH